MSDVFWFIFYTKYSNFKTCFYVNLKCHKFIKAISHIFQLQVILVCHLLLLFSVGSTTKVALVGEIICVKMQGSVRMALQFLNACF